MSVSLKKEKDNISISEERVNVLRSYTPEHIAEEGVILPYNMPQHIIEENNTILPSVTPEHIKSEEDTVKEMQGNETVEAEIKVQKKKNKKPSREKVQKEDIVKKDGGVKETHNKKVVRTIASGLWCDLLEKADIDILSELTSCEKGEILGKKFIHGLKENRIVLQNSSKAYTVEPATSYLRVFEILCTPTSTLEDLYTYCNQILENTEGFLIRDRAYTWIRSLCSLCAKLIEGTTSLDIKDFKVLKIEGKNKWIAEFYRVVYPRLYALVLRSKDLKTIRISDKQWIQLCAAAELMGKGKIKNIRYPKYLYLKLANAGIVEKMEVEEFHGIFYIIAYLITLGMIIGGIICSLVLLLVGIIATVSFSVVLSMDLRLYKNTPLQIVGDMNKELLNVCKKDDFLPILKLLC